MPGLKSAVRRRRITAVTVKLAVLGILVLVLGFAGFVWLLPSEEVALDRNADGIVVLTGGTSRITDALELLAAGRGKRLLITGVNAGTTTGDIARHHDFKSLIVVTSSYHMPRALAELAHQLPDATLIPFPVVSDRLRIEPWWSNGETTKLVLSEYLKYLFAKVRMRFDTVAQRDGMHRVAQARGS
jgi:uncharacterized SAM-binding protein YcdF (DUF218 family)